MKYWEKEMPTACDPDGIRPWLYILQKISVIAIVETWMKEYFMVSVQGKNYSTNTTIKKAINLESTGRMKDALVQMGIKTYQQDWYLLFSFLGGFFVSFSGLMQQWYLQTNKLISNSHF